MDICVLELSPIRSILPSMSTINMGNGMTGERDRVWYGAVAFWILVAGLMTARVMLVDVGKLHPANSLADIAPVSTTTTIGMVASRHSENF